MSSNSFAIVKFATAKLKMKTLPTGFSVALCSTAIQFSDRHSNRSLLLLRIVDASAQRKLLPPTLRMFPSRAGALPSPEAFGDNDKM